MDSHKKLKEMCELIWEWKNEKTLTWWQLFSIWNIKYNEDFNEFHRLDLTKYVCIDVREVIFTKSFMNKFLNYIENNYTIKKTEDVESDILYELDNPLEYLYKIIK